MSDFANGSWAVIQHAGYKNEKLVSTWDSFDDAWCAYQELYTPEEWEELHCDIMKWDEEQGCWSTEY